MTAKPTPYDHDSGSERASTSTTTTKRTQSKISSVDRDIPASRILSTTLGNRDDSTMLGVWLKTSERVAQKTPGHGSDSPTGVSRRDWPVKVAPAFDKGEARTRRIAPRVISAIACD